MMMGAANPRPDYPVAEWLLMALGLVLPFPHTGFIRNLLLGLILIFFIRRQWQQRAWPGWQPLAGVWGVYLGTNLLAALLGVHPALSLREYLGEFIFPFLVYLAARHSFTRRSAEWFITLFIGLGIGLSVYGLVQSVVRTGTISFYYYLHLFLMDYKAMGTLLLMMLPFAIVRAGASRAALAVALFLGFNLIITYCRSAWVGVGGALILYVLIKWRTRSVAARRFALTWRAAAAVASVLFLLAAVLLSSRPREGWHSLLLVTNYRQNHNIALRFRTWLNTAAMVRDHPVFGYGVGIDNFKELYPRYKRPQDEAVWHPHNELYRALLEGGVIGLAALVLLFVQLGRWTSRRIRSAPGDQLVLAYAMMLLAVAIRNQFDCHFLDDKLWLFWLLTGMTVAAVEPAPAPAAAGGRTGGHPLLRAGGRLLILPVAAGCRLHRWWRRARSGAGVRAPRSVLLVRFDFVGDLVTFLPTVARLRAARPDTKLALLIEMGAMRELIARQGICDEIISAEAVLTGLRAGRPSLARIVALIADLRRRRFELVVLSTKHRNLFLNTAAYLVGRGRVIGFPSRSGAQLFERVIEEDPTRPEIDRNLGLLDAFGISRTEADRVPRLRVDEAVADPELAAFLAASVTVIGIHPGAKTPLKRWPAPHFAETINRLAAARPGRLGFLLLGNVEEQGLTRAVAAGLTPAVRFLDCAGRTTLTEAAALISRLDAFIGNDSGLMHLAAAVGTPVVALFGPSDPRQWLPPVDEPRAFIARFESLRCRPCRDPGCDHRQCLSAIRPETVADQALALLCQSAVKGTGR